jgi:HK97 family phage portal protein
MKIGPFEITRRKQAPLVSVDQRGGWWNIIRESATGAWQTNTDPLSVDTLLTYATVYACVSLIASDIGKIRLRLVQQDTNGIWAEADNPAFSPVLRKPNPYQTRIKFIETWITSKLLTGNAYALKRRDNRGVVTALFPLNPNYVAVLIAPDGSVFYELKRDIINGIAETVIVPAREILHDLMVPLYHPLVGVSPITACSVAATQGLTIQSRSSKFFSNGSSPSIAISGPGAISQTTADRIKTYVDTNFIGDNVGKALVLGDGLKAEPLTMKAVDAQLIEQLKWTAETVCSTFHVPPYMVGVGPPPNYNNIEALNAQYYAQCLQTLIESLELCLDEGLGLGPQFQNRYGTEFDLDDLLRMDTKTLIDSEKNAAGIKSPNESRKRLNLPPVSGGETPYLQEQQWPIRMLADRELPTRQPAPTPTAPATPPNEPTEPEPEPESEERGLAYWHQKTAALGLAS